MTAASTAADVGAGRNRRTGLRATWLNFRNRLLASPGFQNWAARFPLTRSVAERHSRALFDLCSGFVYSQVLYACVALKLFDHLADGPATQADLAARTDLHPDTMDRLVGAAAALDLLERLGDGRVALGRLGAAVVGMPAIARMVEHHSMLYADLADPVALLRRDVGATNIGRYWGYGGNAEGAPPDSRPDRDYTTLMSASQAFIVADVLASYDFSRHSRLLDVGGGDGTFIQAVAAKHADLKFTLFDLPPVAERAARKLRIVGLADRTEAVGGDFFTSDLPAQADVVSLVRVVHDHDDDDVLRLFANIRRALPKDGTLIIAEPLAPDREDPVTDAYFGFYFLALGSGRTRTFDEIRQLLTQSGFASCREIRTPRPMFVRVVTANVA